MQSAETAQGQGLLCPCTDAGGAPEETEPAAAGRRQRGDAVADGSIQGVAGGRDHGADRRVAVLRTADGDGDGAMDDFCTDQAGGRW